MTQHSLQIYLLNALNHCRSQCLNSDCLVGQALPPSSNDTRLGSDFNGKYVGFVT